MSKGFDGICIVEDEDEVCKFEIDLFIEIGVSCCDGIGSGLVIVWKMSDDKVGVEMIWFEEIGFENGDDGEVFGLGKDGGGDDFVGIEGLFWVDEGCENFVVFFVFSCLKENC